MAALCPGVKYGLSSQENFGGNKDLIFVKLTDSALRAIEDYLRNQNKFSASQNPTIKFLGNEGQLSFPSFQNGITSFNFSMSTTADMEGPGGSFECIQQLSPPRGSLETLGVVPYKIRIHANDDIYEATRHRMTVAEENHKNKCTREIKPNQTDIGRKVKVKQMIGKPATPPSRRDAPPQQQQQRENVSKTFQSNLSSKPVHPSNGMANGFGNSVNNSRVQNKPSMPDIARRPIKERLIHLLALRPFKKPELYERLVKEGLREKNSMTSILKQISFLKDNAFHLNRAMWNDVREDWPFYTESERQMLKRRKPQNLTPPGSSDGGSSGSGQSPTSTHPGSPPPPISSSKRPGYYDGVDGLPTKRPRISHYRKPSDPIYRPPIENISQRRPVTDSRDASNMNPRSREPTINGYSSNSYSNEILNEKHSDEEDMANRKRSCDSHSLSFNVNREKTYNDSNTSYSPYKDDNVGKDDLQDNTRLANNDTFSNDRIRQKNLFNGDQNKSVGTLNNTRIKDNQVDINRRNNNVSSRPKHSPNDEMEQISLIETGPPNENAVDSEFPDYLTEYATIRSAEQRRRYKSDFNADYAEYRELHAVVEKVSRRFAELEERLKQENISSPKYKDIKKQIVREYNQNKQDLEHQKAKGRFQYLHDKLSHIKRLVLEYDQRIADDRY
ncbi:hypothetical protein RI129_000209 [Pyrocoelia pectoralis]|uniref:OCEL domain-containing protein n=1 Tax=Pyrocoelia pectoralis TaxID=417401 RepID=A0AAN7VHX8_9COLE